MMFMRGFHPSLVITKAKSAKRTTVQMVRPKLMSVSPPPPPSEAEARSAATAGLEVMALLDGQQDGHDQGEEGDALDEAGGHDHGAADVAGGVRLAGDALHGGGGQAADAGGAAHDGEAGADAGSEVRKSLGISGHVFGSP